MLGDGLDGGVSLMPATKVISLRAGSVAVSDPFDIRSAVWGATFLLASVSQFETLPDAVVPASVNCWVTAEVYLLTATITTVLPPRYAETYTFVAGFAVASMRVYPGRTNRAK